MTMRPDHRAQLHALLRHTLTANDGHIPTTVRRSAAATFGISARQMIREITAARRTAGDGANGTAPTPAAEGWWGAHAVRDHVYAALAGTDNVKQAWRKLHADGTVTGSYEQFTRQLKRQVPPAVLAALTGDGREDYLANSLYCTTTAAHRNRLWQADGQEVPVWVRGDRGQPPFKPWQVTFLDDATRTVMATVLVPGHPRHTDVMAALAEAIHGHTAPDGTFIGGIPETVRWDNGKEFLAEAVTEVCARLGIGPRPASPYASWQKGKIERWHQTIQGELYSTLPGASDGPKSFTGRQPWRGEDDQLLTFSSLVLRAQEWVREYNYDRIHSTIGRAPLTAWRADSHPLRYATPAQLHPLMLTLPRTRVVGKSGVSYLNLHYQAPELKDYRGRKVTIRVLPNEVDTVAVFDGDSFVCNAARAEHLSPDRRRQLVRARHADYQQIKTAQDRAAVRRAQDAVIRGLTDPALTNGAPPPADGELLPDDTALLDLLGDDS